MVNVEWDLGDIHKNTKRLMNDMVKGCEDALWNATVIIGNEAEKQVPFDIGTLRDSWRVKPLKDRIGYEMSFNTPYAARMHEHPEYHFQNNRKAKYLEDPIKLNLGDWKGAVVNKLKQVLK